MSDAPRVSVLVPTLDGAADLRRLLPALARQDLGAGPGAGHELVAVDSSSSDATRELLERAGARVETIPRAEFRHGATRNRLAELARAPVLVFLSQDAVPADDGFLARMAAALDDGRTAGATARVLPHAGDDPLTARTVAEAPEASPEPRSAQLAPGRRLADLPPAERAALARFNNVASAIRADVLRELPFPDVGFGEDTAWAERALEAGWRLRHVPECVVHHAHRYGPREAYRRYRTDARFLREAHGVRVRPGWVSVARGVAWELSRDVAWVRRHGGWPHLWRAPALRAAQVLGQWAGSRG